MEPSTSKLLTLPTLLLILFLLPSPSHSAPPSQVCIVGAGIGGSSVAHFLSLYSSGSIHNPLVLERSSRVGGRMATITVGGDQFEAGGTILHPKNLHAVDFTDLLGLSRVVRRDPTWLGVWDGSGFVWKGLRPPPRSSSAIRKWIYSVANSLLIFKRYGLSLLKMNSFVEGMLERFLQFYKDVEERPVFETVDEMLKWSGLHGLTQRMLKEELADLGLSPLLVSELITVIMRINYGQDATISGLAGAVSLAGSNDDLWSVSGGNWQIAEGLLKHSNASLQLEEIITAISYVDGYYELTSAKGSIYNCGVAVIATPLDEQYIKFTPPISIPSRKMQHTHATFIRGLVNPVYFGLKSYSDVPNLIGTLENPDIPFSSISVLKTYSEDDKIYKVFSRTSLTDDLLDSLFSARRETVRIDWVAYPRYEAPESFAPFILDGKHLYYINSFENAASTIETSAVAAENIARLILARLKGISPDVSYPLKSVRSHENLHFDL